MSAFAALLAQPGVEEVSELRGRVGFMAYHGGALEAMTDVIARRAAARADASCYSVIQPTGMREHLPSIKVSPDESAELAAFVERETSSTDIDSIPRQLRGLHPANPVNLPRDGGVQIELPPRVRGSSPLWWDWEGPGLTPHTESLIDALAVAATSWPSTSDG